MAKDKTEDKDIFAETTPAGLPAYPQYVREETGEKYPDGSPKFKELGVAKNPDEHKKMLAGQKDKPVWGNENK